MGGKSLKKKGEKKDHSQKMKHSDFTSSKEDNNIQSEISSVNQPLTARIFSKESSRGASREYGNN